MSQMPIETWITLIIIAIVVFAIFYILSIWIYKRAPTNMAFVRTGFLGTKVCLGRGAMVLPVFHEVTWVSLETIKLIVSRSRDQAILTKDKIRVDMIAELYAHVGHTVEEILRAARSLGEKTFDQEKVRNLLEAKVVSALRSYAATKTLSELHENRDALAQEIKTSVFKSFQSDGLQLEEVTIVSLEQTAKEYFSTDNIFDAEGLKIITEITSNAKREVHHTEKRTTVAIRQRELDTQLELLEIEREEAFARAGQDKSVSNEQALRLGEKQVYILDQRLTVETKEIENEEALERQRTERDLAITAEARRREAAEIQKAIALEEEEKSRQIALITKAREEELANIQRNLTLEQAEKDRQIALVAKAREEELANIQRNLAREQAEKDREIILTAKERELQQADIERITLVTAHEDKAREERHRTSEETSLAIRKRSLENRLSMLELDREESFAAAKQDQEVANEQARVLSEKQRYILEQRWQVEQEEINKTLALEKAQIQKEIDVSKEMRQREASEIQRNLAREQEERNREIALVAKNLELSKAKVAQSRDVELEELSKNITVIAKEQEQERTDIQRFLAREQEERDREIALVEKNRELEQSQIKRLQITALREQAEHDAESVRLVADAKRRREIERVETESLADTRRIDEENKAEIARMHLLSQADSRKSAAEHESEATLIRARSTSEAQQIEADGIERHAGAEGRAQMEVESLRVKNTQRMLEAEAVGIETKADALKKYNEAGTFLELARLRIEADRDIHIDQAKAMGSALQGAQIRMYGGDNGTIDTIRSLFTSGFGLGEALEGVAQALPAGLRERFTENGLRGIFGKPLANTDLKASIDRLSEMVQQSLKSSKARQMPFEQGVSVLAEQAGEDKTASEAVDMLREVNRHGLFDDVPFDKVWSLVQDAAKTNK